MWIQATAPGLALACALAICGLLGAATLNGVAGAPARAPVSSAMIAILLGMTWGIAVGMRPGLASGLAFAATALLRVGVALIGLRLTVGVLEAIGSAASLIALTCLVTAAIAVVAAARLMRITPRAGILLAAGTGVCGCTAVLALAPIVRATPAESAYAMGTVVLAGLVGMFAYPAAAHLLFPEQPVLAGMFLGAAIPDTAQVIGAGMLYAQRYGSPEALDAATVTKLLRNLALVVVVPAAWLWCRRTQAEAGLSAARPPLFVFGFVACAILRAGGDSFADSGAVPWFSSVWPAVLESAARTTEFLIVTSMAAIGATTSLGSVRQLGVRPLFAGLIATGVIALSAVVTVSQLGSRDVP